MSEEEEKALKAHNELLDKKIDDYFENLKKDVLEEYDSYLACDYNKVTPFL